MPATSTPKVDNDFIMPSPLSQPSFTNNGLHKPPPKTMLRVGMVVAFSISTKGTADLFRKNPLVGRKLQVLKPKKYMGVVKFTRPFIRPAFTFDRDDQYPELEYVQILPIGVSPPGPFYWQKDGSESHPLWCIPLVNPPVNHASNNPPEVALSEDSKYLLRPTLYVYTQHLSLGLISEVHRAGDSKPESWETTI